MVKLIIGVAGPSAGGKTSVTNKIKDMFKDKSITVISYDDYYKDQSEMTMDERVKTNYDHPNAFDGELLVEQVTKLRGGTAIKKPTYDFSAHNRSEVVQTVEPTRIIIIEGLFTLLDQSLRDLLDIKIYVETDSDECFIRRLNRDIVERNRTMESVINQYLTTVKPMQVQFIEPTKKFADIIVPRGGDNDVAIDLIQIKIKHLLRHEL